MSGIKLEKEKFEMVEKKVNNLANIGREHLLKKPVKKETLESFIQTRIGVEMFLDFQLSRKEDLSRGPYLCFSVEGFKEPWSLLSYSLFWGIHTSFCLEDLVVFLLGDEYDPHCEDISDEVRRRVKSKLPCRMSLSNFIEITYEVLGRYVTTKGVEE